jgi:hypothetical protein
LTARFVALIQPRGPVLPRPAPEVAPAVDEEEFHAALLEDTYEVIAELELVTPAVPSEFAHLTWPGTVPVTATTTRATCAELHGLGAEQAALVAADAPDLPPLLIGKLFRALGRADVAACPADGGGLVALAVRLPLPAWVDAVLGHCDLDTVDALELLREAAPRPGLVRTGPGWHRIRGFEDTASLDPRLEGWENTRRLLGRRRRPASDPRVTRE